MRPHKHVAPTARDGDEPRYQNVLDISLARFQAAWGEVPVVVTTERERITVYFWNEGQASWSAFEREHEQLTFEGTAPEAPTRWNWSDRVAIACSADAVHVLYKRAIVAGDRVQTAIFRDEFRPVSTNAATGNHAMELTTSAPFISETSNLEGRTQLGRSLWAGCREDGLLVVLYQSRHSLNFLAEGAWILRAATVSIANSGADILRTVEVAPGGFDLDARLDGDTVHAVFRHTADAFRMPLALMLGGGRTLDSGPADDPFYEPLRLAQIRATTLDTVIEPIPGGEHPQIQHMAPLLITFDRPSRLTLTLNPPVMPLPPRQPSVLWRDQSNAKIAWLRDGTEVFRGTLLKSDARSVPHSHADLSESTLLFSVEGGLLRQASPFRFRPVQVLRLDRTDAKLLTVDLLHHREHRALYRTRLRASLSDGVLQVSDRSFEVWDIGHGDISDPDDLAPGADGENAQFEPTGGQAVTSPARVSVLAAADDNTIGGHLTADLSTEPVGYYAYTDLGDGGLRVIYAPDIPALDEPPPLGNEKTLRPEQVTGPHLACDEWVEIAANDWFDPDLDAYPVGLVRVDRSLGSTAEVPLDFLLDTIDIINNGPNPPAPPLDATAGLSQAQLGIIDRFIAEGEGPTTAFALVASDGRAVDLSVAPGGIVEGVPLAVTASVGGQPLQIAVTLARIEDLPNPPDGPLGPTEAIPTVAIAFATGNPATLSAPGNGAHRLSVFLLDGGQTPGANAFVDIEVNASTLSQLRGFYDALAEGELYRIGDLEGSLLKSDLRFGVAAIGDAPSNVRLEGRGKRLLELRLKGDRDRQGTLEARHVMTFTSDDVELRGILGGLFSVESFAVTLRYGRPFTPGVLMQDQRSRSALTGAQLNENPFEIIRRRAPAKHAAIAAKPFGDASISGHSADVKLKMAPGGYALSAVLSLLAVLGATSLIAIIIGLSTAVLIALAAGLAGAAALALAIAALTLFIAATVPPMAAAYAEQEIGRVLQSAETLDRLNEQVLLRYTGEGAAEAVARRVIRRALDAQLPVAPPSEPQDDDRGYDRQRGQVFQMVFVSDGRCRMLLRLDDCRTEARPGGFGHRHRPERRSD